MGPVHLLFVIGQVEAHCQASTLWRRLLPSVTVDLLRLEEATFQISYLVSDLHVDAHLGAVIIDVSQGQMTYLIQPDCRPAVVCATRSPSCSLPPDGFDLTTRAGGLQNDGACQLCRFVNRAVRPNLQTFSFHSVFIPM